MKKILLWWHDNFKRPSTYSGLAILLVGYLILEDKEVVHNLLTNITSNEDFIKMLVGLISGGLIAHKQKCDN